MRYVSDCDLAEFLVPIPTSSVLGPQRKIRGVLLLSNM
jgi:hypothetical protein